MHLLPACDSVRQHATPSDAKHTADCLQLVSMQEYASHASASHTWQPQAASHAGNVYLQLGVSSVREHMDSLVSKAERFNKHKQAQQTQASKLKAALDYERSSDASKKVQEQEGEVVALKAKLQKLEKQEAAGRQARQDQQVDLEEKVSSGMRNCH